jgi:sugar O-acyltransferase (sialic acid O-acetyltransferase NeuD family)
MQRIILLGCGGHAKSVADAIESGGVYEIAGFIGTPEDDGFSYRDYRILDCDAGLDSIYRSGITHAAVCIGFMGRGITRSALYDRLKAIGFTLPVITDRTAVIAADAQIGDGTFVGKNAVVNSAAVVGKMAIINTAAVVEHDCEVGDFSHVSVGSVLCGNVSVGAGSFIGANATVIQGKKIGAGVIVGAGSVVLEDLADGRKAVGIVKQL